ncbi:H-NS histone family protein [Pseudothioclava nitratireducens]|jgi:DNA-binding protein H-NS|uniref:H-NS histone family protein n=1 Tax=Pseudothioclava nitratireducens TaxID=1928646 RepID=UPI0023DAD18B|nr:H-NS histone family protein [Defluviimonas nitratireducens]MDF1619885.1 H-NS histone family protein [Defluviimonas nitratireducens]
MDIDTLSLAELKSLRARVDRAINSFEERKKKEALKAVEEIAREKGFTLAELTEAAQTKTRKPVRPKYANPADASQTWTGRGRKPLWVQAALADGKTLDDLAI